MTETLTGRAACLLLALVWFVSMGVADANAYSYVPLLAGLALVVLLAVSAMIRGAKVVQLSATAWLSLGVGCYFLVRCLCSFSVVESWREASIILGCGVFYVAGVYAAQGRSPRAVTGALGVALVLNMAAFCLMRYTDIPMEWGGRPQMGPGGENHRPVTLFVYKNFAGAFLLVAGMGLSALLLWFRRRAWVTVVCGGISVCAVLISAQCGTRAVFLLAPVLLAVGALMWFVLRLHDGDGFTAGDVFIGFFLLAGICILPGWALMDPDCLSLFTAIDSDGRFAIWQQVNRVLPAAPLYGYGACSVQWMTLPWDTSSFRSLNYAHNEYLQAWCDYGLIGLSLMLFVLFWHSVRVFRVIAEDAVSATRKRLTAAAAMCLWAWGSASGVDFFWHHFAIAGMTAFSLGVIASPYPSENVRKARRRKVVPQGAFGKSVLALFGVSALFLSAWLVQRQWPIWRAQWDYNIVSRQDADGDARRQILARLMPQYPASELMDTYMMLPVGRKMLVQDAQEEMRLLEMVVAANPHQLHMVMRLGARLSEAGRYTEAEQLFRMHYPGDGQDSTRLVDWPEPYVKHLLRWGQHDLYSGERARGYSLLCYALKIVDRAKLIKTRRWRFGEQAWNPYHDNNEAQWKQYLRARRQDVRIQRMLNTEPDDSWQAPMEPGGKPALYRRYGAPESGGCEPVKNSSAPKAGKE